MSIVSWIILGLLDGGHRQALLPGKTRQSLVGTTVIGIAGAFMAAGSPPGGWTTDQQALLRRRRPGQRPSAAPWCC